MPVKDSFRIILFAAVLGFICAALLVGAKGGPALGIISAVGADQATLCNIDALGIAFQQHKRLVAIEAREFLHQGSADNIAAE